MPNVSLSSCILITRDVIRKDGNCFRPASRFPRITNLSSVYFRARYFSFPFISSDCISCWPFLSVRGDEQQSKVGLGGPEASCSFPNPSVEYGAKEISGEAEGGLQNQNKKVVEGANPPNSRFPMNVFAGFRYRRSRVDGTISPLHFA